MNYCDICFVDLDKEDHQDFCPKKIKDPVEELKEMFGMNDAVDKNKKNE